MLIEQLLMQPPIQILYLFVRICIKYFLLRVMFSLIAHDETSVKNILKTF